MKNLGIFITLSVILIIISLAGIIGIFYQQNPTRYYLKGKSSFESGNYVSAIESFTEYLSYGLKNEKSQKARYFLAAAIERKKNNRENLAYDEKNRTTENDILAKKRYLDVINKNTTGTYKVEAVIGYADICRRQNKYDRYISFKLQDILHSFPDSRMEDDIYMLLGYQFLFAGDYTKAMDAFLHSASELAKLGQARTHVKLGQYESAFKIYDDFINFFPSSRYAPKVKKTFTKQVLYYAGLLQKNKKYIEAIPFYKKIVDFFPDDPAAEICRFRIGECYYGLNNFPQARTYFLAATEDVTHKKDDAATFYVGLSYQQEGKYLDAYKYFNLLINQFPTSIYLTRSKQWVKQLKKDLEYFQE